MDTNYIHSSAGTQLLVHYKQELAKAIKNRDEKRKNVVLSVIKALRPDIIKKVNKRE
jgi:hypothetical protein